MQKKKNKFYLELLHLIHAESLDWIICFPMVVCAQVMVATWCCQHNCNVSMQNMLELGTLHIYFLLAALFASKVKENLFLKPVYTCVSNFFFRNKEEPMAPTAINFFC